jgi:hypothetical protein
MAIRNKQPNNNKREVPKVIQFVGDKEITPPQIPFVDQTI